MSEQEKPKKPQDTRSDINGCLADESESPDKDTPQEPQEVVKYSRNSVKKVVLGIDLGTTNTALAMGREIVVLSGKGPVFPSGKKIDEILRKIVIDDEGPLLPSVVAFPPGKEVLVGMAARRRRAIDPPNTIVSSKRLIGKKFASEGTAEFCRMYSKLKLVETEDGFAGFKIKEQTKKPEIISPVDIARILISTACQNANINPEQVSAVVTVPTKFNQEQCNATAKSVRESGIADVTVIDEPYATALAYSSREKPGTAVVYDFGGGTFDFAVVDCKKTPFDIVASDGDLFLGGDDIDYKLALWCVDQALKEYRCDMRSDPIIFDRLILACEAAKKSLSQSSVTRIDLTQVHPAAPEGSMITMDRAIFADLMSELIQKTFLICDDVLRKAGIKADNIDDVFLAGGTVMSPIVWGSVSKYFQKTPRCDFSPFEVISIGASLFDER